MKAWLLDSLSGLEALRIADVPDPVAQPGEVLLSLRFAALNPADRYLAEGAYPASPPLPHILGRDGLGVEAGTGKVRILLRGAAGVSRPGTLAEKVAVPAEYVVDKPVGWTDEQAAAAALTYLTAYQALTAWGDVPDRGTVLITGASGGVGVASLHLARAMGHSVIALSRDPAKQARLRDMGADLALDPHNPKWPDQLSGRRADLAIDNVAGPGFAAVIAAMSDRGRISCVGRQGGEVPRFNTATLFFRRLRIGGVAVGAYTADETRAAWENILALLARTGDKPVVDSVFAFGDLQKAFARLYAGPMGKVLIAIPAG